MASELPKSAATPTPLAIVASRLWSLVAKVNWPILLAVLFLSFVGLLTIHEYADARGESRLAGVSLRQLQYLGAGLVLLVGIQFVNYRNIGRGAWVIYVLSFLPLLYTVVGSLKGGENPLPGVYRLNGAYNWIRLGPLSFQPAELMKVAFILALARYLRFRENYRTWLGLVPPFVLCLAPVVFILKQPDLGTALVFVPTLMAMLFVAGARRRHMLLVILAGVLMLPVVWFSGQPGVLLFEHGPSLLSSYQRDRVDAMFRDDEETLRGVGFQQHRALMAFGSGGVVGKGPGTMPVGVDVPEGHNDMIFALIGEQFGFVGVVAVVGAYLVILIAGVAIAGSTREPFGRLVAVGIVAMVATQAFINLAVSIKLFPVTGITLPFVSAGGSSLLASYLAAGLLMNISRHKPLVMAEDSFEFED